MAKKRLRDVVVTRTAVYYTSEDYFEVRGISLADIVTLVQRHAKTLEELFNKFMDQKGGGEVTREVLTEFLVSAVADVPEIVSEVIGIAADEPGEEGLAMARQLRTPVQIEALMHIAALSITTEAELKKLVETLTKAVTTVTGLAKNLKNGLESETEDEPFRFPAGVSAPVRESIN